MRAEFYIASRKFHCFRGECAKILLEMQTKNGLNFILHKEDFFLIAFYRQTTKVDLHSCPTGGSGCAENCQIGRSRF